MTFLRKPPCTADGNKNKPSKVKTSKTASKPKKKHDPNAHIQENGVRPDPVAQFAQQEGFDSVQYKEDKDIYQRSVRKVQRWLMSIPDDPCSYSTWIYWRFWMKTRKKKWKVLEICLILIKLINHSRLLNMNVKTLLLIIYLELRNTFFFLKKPDIVCFWFNKCCYNCSNFVVQGLAPFVTIFWL